MTTLRFMPGCDEGCPFCGGKGVVCELHPEQPWTVIHQDYCGPGMPCPEANKDVA